MKRVLLFVTASVASIGLFAQSMVSTTPSNRNVVIEDLTGINCGYCPDGALRADQVKASAPDRVVIISNHAGSYATPNYSSHPNSLDFRTTEGSSINSLSSPTGYPAGNVNRMVTSFAMTPGKTAMSRGSWATVASQVFDLPSPLNLAIEAHYITGTNKIYVHVEGYYTSNGTGDDYLTVAVLQDNIDGYQSDYGSPYLYPARIQPNGDYRQMDVLRKYLTTPVLGQKISTTGAKSFFEWTQEYTPAQIGPDIPVVIDDMKIAVFMTEDAGFTEIITATVADVEERPVGINETNALNDLSIYPNPFQNNATIDFNLDKSQEIAVNFFDVTGKVVQSVPSTVYNVGNHKINLDGTNLQSGVYYVNIVAEDGIMTRKVVLNK